VIKIKDPGISLSLFHSVKPNCVSSEMWDESNVEGARPRDAVNESDQNLTWSFLEYFSS